MAAGALSLALAACGTPPQIISITPSRGAQGVNPEDPVTIVFDRPMNVTSVGSRFHLVPSARGAIDWPNQHTLVFAHDVLRADTTYQVVLNGGYSSRAGEVNVLTHSWTFRTEAAPRLTSATPSSGAQGVDPATYPSLEFSRPMDLLRLQPAISITPAVDFRLVQDPANANRVYLVPQTLLKSDTRYRLTISSAALDVNGSHLAGSPSVTFTTGPLQPLKLWLAFSAEATTPATSGGIYLVNQQALPRPLFSGTSSNFAWAPNGTSILAQMQSSNWELLSPDRSAVDLGFQATWARALAGGKGYVYLDQGLLSELNSSGVAVPIAHGVTAAAVSADGTRVAFAVDQAGTSEIRGWDPGLLAEYVLAGPTRGVIDSLSWSPDTSALAYRLLPASGAPDQVWVRELNGGSPRELATGPVSQPGWIDSQHVLVIASVATGVQKIFSLSIAGPLGQLTQSQGLPAGPLGVAAAAASPDGRQIAFIPQASTPTDRQLYVMNADGTAPRAMTSWNPVDFPYSVTALAWTPS